MSTMLLNPNRRVIRATPNPLDKSTIVSIFPKPIHEVKHTIQPGIFDVPAGTFDKPAILVVGSSSWWRELDEEQPMLEIPVGSVQIADSIIKDYSNGLLGCDMGESMPGLFWIPGEHNQATVIKNHRTELDRAKIKQDNWYRTLVEMADTLWARSNGNPIVICDDMRIAANSLNLLNKEWLKDQVAYELVRCVACGSLNNSTVVVCPNCKVVVNPEEFKKLNLQFASK